MVTIQTNQKKDDLKMVKHIMYHPHRGFISELKSAEQRGGSFQMTDQVDKQVADHLWPYINQAHFQGLAFVHYAPGGQISWSLPDIVSYRPAPGGQVFGLPFLSFDGNDGSNSVPRLDARLEDLKCPMPVNMTLVGSAERALEELYTNNCIVGGANTVIHLGAVPYTIKHHRAELSHRVGYVQAPVPTVNNCPFSTPRELWNIGLDRMHPFWWRKMC